MNMDAIWLQLVSVVLPALLGGGLFGTLSNYLVKTRRMERVDRVAELAEQQQAALERAIENENALRLMLFQQKDEMRKLESAWRDRTSAIEEKYQKKCDEIEEEARLREEEYQAEIAMLRSELDRLRILILRHGVDPDLVCDVPSAFPE
ncbi:MAG: hypothetical protein GVY30_12225 [Chloroflexi bacterium]|jgi:ribosomal protein S18|nr:hypothetical protein [Chloroflexota bacterium]